MISIFHSSVSPSLRSRKATIPSGIVARRDLDPGRAIEVLDLRLISVAPCVCAFRGYLFLPTCRRRSLYMHGRIVFIGRCIWQLSWKQGKSAATGSPNRAPKSKESALQCTASRANPGKARMLSRTPVAYGFASALISSSAASNANTSGLLNS
jgi:hypothetical protein